MTELAGPIDELHAECLILQRQIRDAYRALRIEASLWEPRPMPGRWQK